MKKLTATVIIAVSIITLGSFILSFSALEDFALKNGAPGNLAWIWPILVDMTVVVCTVVILMAELKGWNPLYPIGLVVLYGVVTIVGNLWHAPATKAGWFVAILPPLTLIALTELLRVVTKNILAKKPASVVPESDTDPTELLTERQQQVLELVRADVGKTEIAKQLSVSVRTVEREIKSLNGRINETTSS